jgi:hypothetical protein
MKTASPLRGLNHHAVVDGPEIPERSAMTVLRTGRYDIIVDPSLAEADATYSNPYW